jgi:hypothetical protein
LRNELQVARNDEPASINGAPNTTPNPKNNLESFAGSLPAPISTTQMPAISISVDKTYKDELMQSYLDKETGKIK